MPLPLLLLLPLLPLLQVFLYPIAAVVLAVPLLILLGANPTKLALKFWFDYS